ncbi:hypothetical protein LPJ75_004843, partial [Coemansia sp. RSA 2598]
MTGTTAIRSFPDPAGIHTARGFDDLSPNERDQFIGELELDFRRYLAENRPPNGFVFYPNTRRIMKAIS